jgi:hypothetical protein
VKIKTSEEDKPSFFAIASAPLKKSEEGESGGIFEFLVKESPSSESLLSLSKGKDFFFIFINIIIVYI